MENVQEIIQRIELANNGYLDIGNNPEIIQGVKAAGYMVLSSTNLHGRPTHKAYTERAQQALKEEHASGSEFAVMRQIVVPPNRVDGPDYEAMILARQDQYLL